MCVKSAWIAGAAALLLAGCGSAPPEPDSSDITVRFVPVRDDQVIEIRALGSRAIASAELVQADGARIAAYSIDAERDPVTSGGNSPDHPVPPGSSINTSTTRLIGQIASVALIRVTYPADYAQSWQEERIALRLGYGADTISQLLAAPAPK